MNSPGIQIRSCYNLSSNILLEIRPTIRSSRHFTSYLTSVACSSHYLIMSSKAYAFQLGLGFPGRSGGSQEQVLILAPEIRSITTHHQFHPYPQNALPSARSSVAGPEYSTEMSKKSSESMHQILRFVIFLAGTFSGDRNSFLLLKPSQRFLRDN